MTSRQYAGFIMIKRFALAGTFAKCYTVLKADVSESHFLYRFCSICFSEFLLLFFFNWRLAGSEEMPCTLERKYGLDGVYASCFLAAALDVLNVEKVVVCKRSIPDKKGLISRSAFGFSSRVELYV